MTVLARKSTCVECKPATVGQKINSGGRDITANDGDLVVTDANGNDRFLTQTEIDNQYVAMSNETWSAIKDLINPPA